MEKSNRELSDMVSLLSKENADLDRTVGELE